MPRRKPKPPLALRVSAPVGVVIVILVGWISLSHFTSIPHTLLPAPQNVIARLIRDLAAGRLDVPVIVTIQEALLGCAVAVIIALPLAWAIAHSALVDAALSPYLAASQAIPAIALAPLLVIWMGYGLAPVVTLCAIMVVFPMILSTVLGLRRIDPELLDAARVDGAGKGNLALYIEWPLALPAVLTGMRNGFTLSVTGAVVGELVMGGSGLGQQLAIQSQSNDTTGLFATLVVLCVLASLIFLIARAIEWLTDPYASRQRWRIYPTIQSQEKS